MGVAPGGGAKLKLKMPAFKRKTSSKHFNKLHQTFSKFYFISFYLISICQITYTKYNRLQYNNTMKQ